ncbi:MAG: hypothetical protein GTN80_07330 [Nitrososphaeria archaeon]|nr:hypothetical protein [Nitrososphaeria archaeon]NIQ33437.1 hypothetical protein [Nitrososphaeria archaeon]
MYGISVLAFWKKTKEEIHRTFFTNEEREVLKVLRRYKKERSWVVGRVIEELDMPTSRVTRIREELKHKKLDFLHLLVEALELGLIDKSELDEYVKYRRIEE